MRPRMKLFLMAIGLCLLLAAGAQAGPLFGGARVLDIHFTNYGDGMHLTINPDTGLVVGYRTGTENDPLYGTVGVLMDGTYRGGAVTVMDKNHSLYCVILDKPSRWIYYSSGGVKFNAGSYHVGVPMQEGAVGVSTQK